VSTPRPGRAHTEEGRAGRRARAERWTGASRRAGMGLGGAAPAMGRAGAHNMFGRAGPSGAMARAGARERKGGSRRGPRKKKKREAGRRRGRRAHRSRGEGAGGRRFRAAGELGVGGASSGGEEREGFGEGG
jgi:hypothetical protein